MAGYQSVVSDASSRKRAYKEDEDVETTDDIFSAKFSYHLSRMHYHLPYSMCKKCITDFFADSKAVMERPSASSFGNDTDKHSLSLVHPPE
ncbi:hypothetical protein AAVH_16344 [Aphelenchoides avenae]|nr:hypothetical protein AAVH_16344 [Aphelenchus avenae]